MFIDLITNHNFPPAFLLRESIREKGKVKKPTLANLSELPSHLDDTIKTVLIVDLKSPPRIPPGKDNSGLFNSLLPKIRIFKFILSRYSTRYLPGTISSFTWGTPQAKFHFASKTIVEMENRIWQKSAPLG
jgi:hypothetical protein